MHLRGFTLLHQQADLAAPLGKFLQHDVFLLRLVEEKNDADGSDKDKGKASKDVREGHRLTNLLNPD